MAFTDSRIFTGDIMIRPHFRLESRLASPDSFRGIGLLCIDIENLLAGYGQTQVYEKYESLKPKLIERGIRGCLVTNMDDHERALGFADQTGLPMVHKRMIMPDGAEMPSKSHADPYQWAVDNVGFGPNGVNAAMVDDQIKNIAGAQLVPEFTEYYWTRPDGLLRSHKGVLAFRPIELAAGMLVSLAQRDDNVGVHPNLTYSGPTVR